MLSLENINVCFMQGTAQEKLVLSDLNLTVAAGRFCIVIGGNGAGKSTLMNVIAGEVKAQSGKIYLDGCEISKQDTKTRAKAIGRVFQDPYSGSFPSLTLEENLALAVLRGEKRPLSLALSQKNKARFREALAVLGSGLEDRLQEKMASFSGGQRQSVALLMATLKASKLLLLDEHTAALDPKMAHKVVEVSNELIRKDKLTTLMITHSMKQAINYGDETILLAQGRIAKKFSPHEFKNLKSEELISLFG